jgi:uncharacterized protein DUF4282
MEQEEHKGFFASLFDTSFDELITPRIIKVLYILFMIVLGLFALVFVISAFSQSSGLGALTLFVLAPLGFLLYLIMIRVYLELVIVLFKIKESTERMADK